MSTSVSCSAACCDLIETAWPKMASFKVWGLGAGWQGTFIPLHMASLSTWSPNTQQSSWSVFSWRLASRRRKQKLHVFLRLHWHSTSCATFYWSKQVATKIEGRGTRVLLMKGRVARSLCNGYGGECSSHFGKQSPYQLRDMKHGEVK